MKFKVYQQIDAIIKDKNLDETDKGLYSVCAVYDLTEEQLDNMNYKRVLKMADKVAKEFNKKPDFKAANRIGIFKIQYGISKLTFGQYIELAYFSQFNIFDKANFILASAAKTFYKVAHPNKSDYFSNKDLNIVIGTANKIIENFTQFNLSYKQTLFSKEEDSDTSDIAQKFNKNYGWIYSASVLAEYERITLQQAYNMNVKQALNGLTFLKAKNKFETYLRNKK